jgi:hypothetical protein
MLLPINLTGVLYVVQRMESMANLFVLLGLVGYVTGRCRMLSQDGSYARGLVLCIASVIAPTAIGMMAKETAVMLPLYAFLVEAIAFRFNRGAIRSARRDRWLILLFTIVLALPLFVGLTWLLPGLLRPGAWSTRDFTMSTRLLSEARIVVDYIGWTLLPLPHHLSFYHDYFHISTGLLKPWTTLASIIALVALAVLAWWSRRRYPLVALGIALYLGCHLLTSTILPLELIYEHRNYFASFGLLLAIVPLLAAPPTHQTNVGGASAPTAQHQETEMVESTATIGLSMALPRYVLLGGLLALWTLQTALTAYAWGDPLRLAQDLATRAPTSPRAQYELGRTYIIYSHYDPASIFTKLAYAPLERSAALPDSSILAEQALIFMNSRMNLPLKDAWWDSMITKLKAQRPGVQDESSLGALTQCAREQNCDLPKDRMMEAFLAALSHPSPSARLLAIYGDYAWNVMDDKTLGERMLAEAVKAKPDEPAYHITLVRMLAAQGRNDEARQALKQLETLNIGGRLDGSIAGLRALLPPQ